MSENWTKQENLGHKWTPAERAGEILRTAKDKLLNDFSAMHPEAITVNSLGFLLTSDDSKYADQIFYTHEMETVSRLSDLAAWQLRAVRADRHGEVNSFSVGQCPTSAQAACERFRQSSGMTMPGITITLRETEFGPTIDGVSVETIEMLDQMTPEVPSTLAQLEQIASQLQVARRI